MIEYIQPSLFAESDVETAGYAQPEPRSDETNVDGDTSAEATQ